MEKMQVIKIAEVSYWAFLAMLQFIYTNDFDESVSPLHMVELIRSLYLFIFYQFVCLFSALVVDLRIWTLCCHLFWKQNFHEKYSRFLVHYFLLMSKTVFYSISVENLVKQSMNEITVLKFIGVIFCVCGAFFVNSIKWCISKINTLPIPQGNPGYVPVCTRVYPGCKKIVPVTLREY